jgi:mycoredoxin
MYAPPGMISAMRVLLYSAAWCRDCREAKRFLDQHGISYTEIDIESVDGAAEEVIRNVGKRAIPQLVIDGKWFQPYRPGQGLLYQELGEVLGITITN